MLFVLSTVFFEVMAIAANPASRLTQAARAFPIKTDKEDDNDIKRKTCR